MKNIYLLLLILFTIVSCEKEDPIENYSSLEGAFQNSNISNSIPYDFRVDWASGSEIFSENFNSLITEYPIIYNSAFNPTNFGTKQMATYTISKTTEDNGVKFYTNKYINLKNNKKKPFVNSQRFNGKLDIFQEDGDLVFTNLVRNGSVIAMGSTIEGPEIQEKKFSLNRQLLIVWTDSYTDWYTEDGNGGGGMRYVRTTHNGRTAQYYWSDTDADLYDFYTSYPDDFNGGGGSGSSNTRTVSVEESTLRKIRDRHLIDEIIIDPSFKNTKAECVYNKLNQLSSNFKSSIKNFDREFTVADLALTVDYGLTNIQGGVTNNSHNDRIIIKINGNLLENRTALGIARTLAHEVIHAELYRKVRSVGGSVSINNFPGIYDYYRRHVKNWQHEQMAAHYRATISKILKEFDGNDATDSQFYDDFTWEGLTETTSWTSLSPEERTRIETVILNYKKNGNKSCN
ncbi:hypothetical protein [Nonlabens antarcticus]|uniref:hypothetical protein n=1 Tax=Nonlabens antarcticus TaxID=392714 RepID=UPI0018917100|nr:hypothetical protein [Nonlabens antarcticus]